MLKDISEGEGDLTKGIAVTMDNEIGDMANYLNATLEKIKAMIITIKKQSTALFGIGNELVNNSPYALERKRSSNDANERESS